jgi:hypothetical protein
MFSAFKSRLLLSGLGGQHYRALLAAAFLAAIGITPAHSELINIKAFDNGVLVGDKTGVGMLQLVVSCTSCLPPVSDDPAFSFFIVNASGGGGIPYLDAGVDFSTPLEAGHVITVDVTETGLSGVRSQTATSFSTFQSIPTGSISESVAVNGVAFQSFSVPNAAGQSETPSLLKLTSGPIDSIEETYSLSFPVAFPPGDAVQDGVDVLNTAANIDFQSFGVVPEASTWAMMLIGFAGLAFAGRAKAGHRHS